jgi:polysaccharide biosynthesis transport protein
MAEMTPLTGRSDATPAAAVPAANPYAPDSDVHILDRFAILYRYRQIAITVFILTTAVLMIQGYTNIKLFQARAQLQIEDERSTAVPGINSPDNTYYEDPEPYYNTQFRILKGRELARRVVRRLKLETIPEFNGTAVPPPTPVSMLVDFEKRMLALVRKPAEQPVSETPKVDETPDESALVSSFLSRVGVEPIRTSRLVDVTFVSVDPNFAALGANTLVDEYTEQNLAIKLESSQNMLDWLAKELEKQQQKVQESEQSLATYRDKQNAMSLDDKQNIVTTRLSALNDALIKARTAKAQKEALYSQVKVMSTGTSPDAIAVISQNLQVQAVKTKMNELLREKSRLEEKYGPKHLSVQANITQIQDTQHQLDLETSRALQTVKNDYETAVLEERTLAQNLEAAKADAQDLSRKSVGYNVMEREAKSNRLVYESLLQREKELRVSSNSRQNNVRIVDRAEVPKSPLAATGRRTWMLSSLIGFVLAVAVAFGLDYMNDTIKTPEDVTRRLKLPFLGLVPSVRGDKHPLLTSSHVAHDFGEAFRALRTSLISKFPSTGTKTLIVTSAQPLEGKTTTAANIAMALAYGGARVLLIDGDMRRPGLHRPLRLANDRGLSQVLIGQARVRDVIQRTVDPNLLAITAGKMPPNPSELLASERMRTLLTNLAHGPFDWIVIDTPPVLAVTDAVILAPMVSGVAFVVGAEMTRRRLAERALETIMSSHPRYVAVVLNRVDFARNKYYYSRYYGHQYKNYYAEATV